MTANGMQILPQGNEFGPAIVKGNLGIVIE